MAFAPVGLYTLYQLYVGLNTYDTKKDHAAIAERGAEAIIPVRKNGKRWNENTPGAHARNETVRATERLGRAHLEELGWYHRRRLVETKMRCFKRLGERINARLFSSQVAELQIRAALLKPVYPVGHADHGRHTLNPSNGLG